MADPIGVSDKIKDALDAMSARDLERVRSLIDRRLVSCIICHADGAYRYRVSRRATCVTMTFCPACFEKYRLPEGRAEEKSEPES